MDLKNALKEMAQRPRKRGIWHFFMICGWSLPQNHSPARRNLKIFRPLKFVEHDLRTLFWAIFGAKVTPPGYPVGVGVPEKGHLGSGEMGHPNLDEKNGCWKILPASGLVWASQSLLKTKYSKTKSRFCRHYFDVTFQMTDRIKLNQKLSLW